MATTPVRIGVVGGGLVAQAVHIPLLQRLSTHYAIAGLAEPHAPTRDAVAARHRIERAVPDHGALLDAGGVDALLVASPDASHARIVLDALAAGAHVLVEKPLCTTIDEGEAIVAASTRAALVVQVGYMKRFDPAVERLLDDLDGVEPVHIATTTFDPGMRAAFCPPGLEAAGAAPATDAFLGALVHDVNLVRAVLARCGAEVDRIVDAFGERAGARAGGTLGLRGGGRWTAAWLALPGAGTFREHLAIYSADGVRELEFPAPYALHAPTTYRHTGAAGGGEVTTAHRSWAEAYERQLLHFHACVTAGAACRTPPEDALDDVRLLTGLMEAA